MQNHSQVMRFAFVVAGLSLSYLSSSFAQGPTTIRVFCIDQIERRTAALVARDWEQLAGEAQTYVSTCGLTLGADHMAGAYEHLAMAHLELRNPRQALRAADTCLTVFYGKTGCHIGRARALLNQNRPQDARVAVERAERLLEAAIPRLERNLKVMRSANEREVTESHLEELKAQQGYVGALKEKLADLLGE